MIIKPKIRGFICTTAHPAGCEANVREQIAYVKSRGELKNGPKRCWSLVHPPVTVWPRINAAFGSGAATIGVFFEKPGSEGKTGSAGWYNSAGFDKAAKEEGLYAKSINGDAFSNECRQTVIDLIKKDLGQVDLVVYSLASPVRKMPETGEVVRSALKPIGEPYKSVALDTNKDVLVEAVVEPANEQEIADTVKVMGGQDWQLWMDALDEAGVLADNAQSVAYSHRYRSDLANLLARYAGQGERRSGSRGARHQPEAAGQRGAAYVAVLKSVVTQASSAIPVMPLYISIVFKIMKEQGIHEGCIEQIQRLFATKLYSGAAPDTDEKHRLRLDDWELRDEVQETCREIWQQLNDSNINELTDYQGYKAEFLRLFGFGLQGVDYDADLSGEANFDVIELV